MAKPATIKIHITLAGLTRVEYGETLEVPADFTPGDLEALVEQRYDEVDGGKYFDDPDYWERGSCYWQKASAEDKVEARVTRDAEGEFILTEVAGSGA